MLCSKMRFGRLRKRVLMSMAVYENRSSTIDVTNLRVIISFSPTLDCLVNKCFCVAFTVSHVLRVLFAF